MGSNVKCCKMGYGLQLQICIDFLGPCATIESREGEGYRAICWAWHRELIATCVMKETYASGQPSSYMRQLGTKSNAARVYR